MKHLTRFKNIMYNDIPSPIIVLSNENMESQELVFCNKSFNTLFMGKND
jgi:hypothetical protein